MTFCFNCYVAYMLNGNFSSFHISRKLWTLWIIAFTWLNTSPFLILFPFSRSLFTLSLVSASRRIATKGPLPERKTVVLPGLYSCVIWKAQIITLNRKDAKPESNARKYMYLDIAQLRDFAPLRLSFSLWNSSCKFAGWPNSPLFL